MLDRLSPTKRNLALAALAALVLWFSWTVRSALNPLLLGLLFAYMLHPLVMNLERRGWTRKSAVNVIFGGAALGLTLMALGLWWQGRELWLDVSRENGVLSQIDDRIDEGLAWAQAKGAELGLREAVEDAEAPVEALTLSGLYEQFREWLKSEEGLAGAEKAAGSAWVLLRRVFGSLMTFAGLLFLVPMYTWFLLFELERISQFVRRYIPERQRGQFSDIGGQIAEMLGNFFRGRMLVCLLKGLILSLVMWAVQIPYALLLGMLAGFLSLIPFAGPGVGYGLAFLLALIDVPGGGGGELAAAAEAVEPSFWYSPLGALVRIAIVSSVGELAEGYVLMPKILGDSLGLHPVVVLASLMIAGAALGMFGLLLALPLTATAIILTRELVLPALRDFADEDGPGDGAVQGREG